jgi:hypothetical protein
LAEPTELGTKNSWVTKLGTNFSPLPVGVFNSRSASQ